MVKVLALRELAGKIGLDDMLIYRPKAKDMLDLVTQDIEKLEPGTIVKLDFQEIKLCDVSFADGFVISLQLLVQKIEGVMMELVNCCEDVLANIEATLNWRNQKSQTRTTLLYQDSTGQYTIFGKPEKSLSETFYAVIEMAGKVTARDISQKFAPMELNSANNRLKKLYDSRLLCRETDESGWQQYYFIPDF